LNLGDVRIPAADHTLSFWYFNTGGTTADRIVDARIAGSLYVVVSNNRVNGRLSFYGKTATGEDVNDAFTDNAWHYIEIVQSGSTVTCTVTKPDGTTKSSVRTIEIDDITASRIYFLGGYNPPNLYANGSDGRVARIQLTTGGVTTQIEPIANSRSVIKNVDGVETTIEDAITGGTVSTLLTTDPIPKRWDEELDSLGLAADNSESFGVARRDGQLEDGACISLDGVNQYGTITNSDDFSGEDWTLSGRFVWDGVSSTRVVFSQLTGTSWLYSVNGVLKTNLGAGHTFAITTLLTAKEYAWEIEKSGSDFTLRITNVTDDLTQEAETISLTMASSTGDFMIGENTAGSNHFGGKMWDLKLDHANGFELPMAEGSGTTSYDVSGNGKDCTWGNSPSWGNQSSYFWNENQGCDVVGTFDGVDDYIQGAAVAMSSEMTLTFWGKYDFSIGSAPWSLICNRVDADNGISISSNGEGNNFFTFRLAGTNYSTNLSLSGLFGDWAHYSIILSAGTVTVYRNNAAVTPQSSAASGIPADVGFFIGKRNTNYSPSGTQIHSARVYSKALTADERTHVYTDGASGTDPTLTDCLLKYDIDEGSGLTVADSSGNGNDGTINGATSDEFWGTIIPAASDGTSLIRATPSNPAGPWLYEGLGSTYVNFDVVPNANQWLEQRWIGAEFDGSASRLDIVNTGTTIFQFDDVWEWKALLFTSTSGVQGIATIGNATEGFTLTASELIKTHFQAGYVNVDVGYTLGEENDLTVSMDGSGTSLTLSNINATNGLTEYTRIAAFTQIGEPTVIIGKTGGSYWDGEMRSLKYTHEGTVYFDTPLLGCSLDLSSEVNHGTDTNITYNRLTDVSYQAGDTVEQPFSVNDDTAGRVSELIQFTFPKV
jgi:hypothetical protein